MYCIISSSITIVVVAVTVVFFYRRGSIANYASVGRHIATLETSVCPV